MTENITFNLEHIFDEIVDEGMTNGVLTEAAYHELVDEAIEERRRLGEIHDDQDTEEYVTLLKERWPEYQQRIAG